MDDQSRLSAVERISARQCMQTSPVTGTRSALNSTVAAPDAEWQGPSNKALAAGQSRCWHELVTVGRHYHLEYLWMVYNRAKAGCRPDYIDGRIRLPPLAITCALLSVASYHYRAKPWMYSVAC